MKAICAWSGRAWRAVAAVVLACVLALPAAAQLLPSTGGSPAAVAERPRDPLGRDTPRGTISGFVRAANAGDYALASRYLQAMGRQRAQAADLAQELGALMDRHYHQPLPSISDAPEGRIDDGVPPDRERIGPMRLGGEEQYIELVKVDDAEAGPVWLVASATLGRIGEWAAASEPLWFERMLPDAVAASTLGGVPLGALFAWAASLLLPLAACTLVFLAVVAALRRLVRDPERRALVEAWQRTTRWPLVLSFTLAAHLLALPSFGTTFGFRVVYMRVGLVVLLGVLAWGLQRSLVLWLQLARTRLQRRGRTGAGSLMLLGERLTKLFVIVVAALAMLAVAGVDIKAVLAGLGIVGIAVALGAQKTVENILGGVLLLGDEAIAIGDFCAVSDRLGVVEDITLRSVRIRTLEQTLLSIPAGALAQGNIENYASRGKILAKTTLRLEHGASVAQVRAIREGIAALLAAEPTLEADTARIRLVDFGVQGIELELFAYVLTSSMLEFLAVRENLLLQAAQVVEAEGASFARVWRPEERPPA